MSLTGKRDFMSSDCHSRRGFSPATKTQQFLVNRFNGFGSHQMLCVSKNEKPLKRFVDAEMRFFHLAKAQV